MDAMFSADTNRTNGDEEKNENKAYNSLKNVSPAPVRWKTITDASYNSPTKSQKYSETIGLPSANENRNTGHKIVFGAGTGLGGMAMGGSGL